MMIALISPSARVESRSSGMRRRVRELEQARQVEVEI